MSELSAGTFEAIGSVLPAGVFTVVGAFVDVFNITADTGIGRALSGWGLGGMGCESKFVDGRSAIADTGTGRPLT